MKDKAAAGPWAVPWPDVPGQSLRTPAPPSLVGSVHGLANPPLTSAGVSGQGPEGASVGLCRWRGLPRSKS